MENLVGRLVNETEELPLWTNVIRTSDGDSGEPDLKEEKYTPSDTILERFLSDPEA